MQKPILDKEAMIKWLGEVIDAELEKSDDEIDMALVMECDAYLAELMSDVEISEEQIKENIANIMKKHSNDKITSTVSRRTPRRRRLIAIACSAAIFAGGTVSAYAFVPAFRDMVRDVLNLGQGSSVDEGGVTYIYYGKATTYRNIEELVQSENLGIIYPHNLPEELKIKSIVGSGDAVFPYTIGFVDNIASIVISTNEVDVSELSSNSKVFKNSKNITSYILVNEETTVSTTIYGGWTYYITAKNIEYIYTILENLY